MKSSYSEFFWSVFSCIQTEYGEIRSICPYSVRMRENTDQKNSEYGYFSLSGCYELLEVFIPYQLDQQSIKTTFSENAINFETYYLSIWFNICRKADNFLTFFYGETSVSQRYFYNN